MDRFFASVCRNNAGSGLCVFLKGQITANGSKITSGFCFRSHGGSFGVVAFDSGFEYGGKYNGKSVGDTAAAGFLLGMGFLLLMDQLTPHLHLGNEKPEGLPKKLKKTTMLVLAVTLHNIPEGMAVGAVFAGMVTQNAEITAMGAFALSIGIAIQNFQEGAIISMPLKSETGMNKGKAFLYGTLSGIVEPIAAVVMFCLADVLEPILPSLLAFAAGAMLYVVIEELIPETAEGEHSNMGTIGFAVGFVLMMVMDVALG